MSVGKDKKNSVLERDNYQCWICLYPIDPALKFPDLLCGTVDHIREKYRGGTDAYDNLRAAHNVCNVARANGYTRNVAIEIKNRKFEFGRQIDMILKDVYPE